MNLTSSATLTSGDRVTAQTVDLSAPTSLGQSSELIVSLSSRASPTYVTFDSPLWFYQSIQISPLSDGGFVLGLVSNGHGGGNFVVDRFDAAGHLQNSTTVVTTPSFGSPPSMAVAGLADGNYVAAWSTGGGSFSQEYLAATNTPFGPRQPLSPYASAGGQPSITPDGEGGYQVSFSTTSGAQAVSFRPVYLDAAGQPMPVSGWPSNDMFHSFHSQPIGGQTLNMNSLPGIVSTLQSPAGLVANGGNNTVIASDGDQSFWVGPTDTVIVPVGLAGTKTIYAYNYSEALPAGVNNLVFYGPDNTALGNALANLIIMGSDDRNWMDGGPGNDVLVGGAGQNNFLVEAGNGSDTIYGFHTSQDTVKLGGVQLGSFAQVRTAMEQHGRDVVLHIDPTETLTFRGVSMGDFTAADFILPQQNAVSTGDAVYRAADGVTAITLTASGPQTVTGNNAGDTFNSNSNGNHLAGGTGDDTFNLGRGGDWAVGNGGNDTYSFAAVPWAGAHIGDFNPGDRLDLTGLMATTADRGSDGFADGYLKITDDGAGDAQVWADYHLAGNDAWWLVATLGGVSTSSLQHSGDVIAMSAPTGGGGGTGGQTYTSDNAGDHWTGTSGNDTFNLGRGGDVVAGGGGADVFKFAEVPWGSAHITDFGATDSVDLTGMLTRSGYTGSTPIVDGYVTITADSTGSAQIWSDPHNGTGSWLVATLDGISPNAVRMNGDMLVSTAGSGSPTPPGGAAPGQTYTSDNNGDQWTGTTGNDTFHIGRGGDVVTGGAGVDAFAFAETPWAGAVIKDFSHADGDRIDLSGLLAHSGYTGSDPFADGYLKYTTASDGSAQLWSDVHQPGNEGWWLVATLDAVSTSSLHYSGGMIT